MLIRLILIMLIHGTVMSQDNGEWIKYLPLPITKMSEIFSTMDKELDKQTIAQVLSKRPAGQSTNIEGAIALESVSLYVRSRFNLDVLKLYLRTKGKNVPLEQLATSVAIAYCFHTNNIPWTLNGITIGLDDIIHEKLPKMDPPKPITELDSEK